MVDPYEQFHDREALVDADRAEKRDRADAAARERAVGGMAMLRFAEEAQRLGIPPRPHDGFLTKKGWPIRVPDGYMGHTVWVGRDGKIIGGRTWDEVMTGADFGGRHVSADDFLAAQLRKLWDQQRR